MLFRFFGVLLVCGFISCLHAQRLPDLKNQQTWGEKEKEEFLRHLRSNQNMAVTGNVREFQAPSGLELALIPLGTPHTRYIILRGGASAHYFTKPKGYQSNDFEAPLQGLRGAWNLGLGYEWQIADSNWRIHTLLEGYKSFERRGSDRFFGAGLTAGFVYTL
ncbi:MAG: hypothetical protein HY747_00150 [Elusimicrobia bacterium]|nr:hypothetical protein [Elusimicrobiota bacterium]